MKDFTNIEVEVHPLKAFIPKGAHILILGSFPPPKNKWCIDFYYPNYINDMWRILGLIYYNDKDYLCIPEEKKFNLEKIIKFCNEKGIAFYDTAEKVKRLKANASDKFLEIIKLTDINRLLESLPKCNAIITTGEKACQNAATVLGTTVPKIGESIDIPNKLNGPDEKGRILKLFRLPSSSRAYPMKLEKKAEEYSKIFRQIDVLKWEQRYAPTMYVFGTEASPFIVKELNKLREHQPGKVLFIGEGEGRNAVKAGQMGWDVYACDLSNNAKEKALKLAKSRKVNLHYKVQDVYYSDFETNFFDIIVMNFIMFPVSIASTCHKKIASYIKPGGYLILDGFSTHHLEYDFKHGPIEYDMLFSRERIQQEFPDLKILTLREFKEPNKYVLETLCQKEQKNIEIKYNSCTLKTAEYAAKYQDIPKFEKLCKACKHYGNLECCPPFKFDPAKKVLEYKYIDLHLFTILIPKSLKKRSSIELLKKIREDKIDSLLKFLEMSYRNQEQKAIALLPGSSINPTVNSNERYSLESLGFNVSLTTQEIFNKKLLWEKDGILPDYLLLVGAILHN
ncbi:MAG: methyltransferase domain-containing protein [Bacteroidales bacterium]